MRYWYYSEIIPNKVWRIPMPPTLPKASRNPCFLNYRSPSCLRYPCVDYGGRLLKAGKGRIRRMVQLGVGGRLRSYFSTLSIGYLNKKQCCSVSDIKCVYASKLCCNSFMNLYWCIISHSFIWFKVNIMYILYVSIVVYVLFE